MDEMDEHQEKDEKARRKPGPTKRLDTRQYVVMLEEETAEWGKGQPGGLSDLVRRLLRRAKQEATSGP